jgi:hypothetical protein
VHPELVWFLKAYFFIPPFLASILIENQEESTPDKRIKPKALTHADEVRIVELLIVSPRSMPFESSPNLAPCSFVLLTFWYQVLRLSVHLDMICRPNLAMVRWKSMGLELMN